MQSSSIAASAATIQPLLFSEYNHSQSNDLCDERDASLAAISISQLAINLLNSAHNNCADETGMIKGLKTLGIEIGLFASSMILAPVEAITRLAIGIILLIPALIGNGICGENNFSNHIVYDCMGIGSLFSALAIAYGSVSLFTNIAYSDKEIDYIGQAEKYVHFYEPTRPQNIEQTTSHATRATREQRADRFVGEEDETVFLKVPGQFRSLTEIRRDRNFTTNNVILINSMNAMLAVKNQNGYNKASIDQMLSNPDWSPLEREILTYFKQQF